MTVLLQSASVSRVSIARSPEIAFGQRMHELFQRLVARGYARPHSCGCHGARFYHLNSKTLYRVIGAAGHRHQQPMSLGAAIGRLMLLDAVLADRQTGWLDTERAKSAHLHQCFVGYASPGLADFGANCSTSIPAELRAMPVGVRSDDDGELVLLYLVTTPKPVTFRAFLRRHTSILSAVPMTIRLVIPERLRWCEDDLRNAFRAHVVTASISSNSETPTESNRAIGRPITWRASSCRAGIAASRISSAPPEGEAKGDKSGAMSEGGHFRLLSWPPAAAGPPFYAEPRVGTACKFWPRCWLAYLLERCLTARRSLPRPHVRETNERKDRERPHHRPAWEAPSPP